MPGKNIINILLIEDEEFDVRRVKNTIKLFEDQIQIADTVSNGDAAIKLLNNNKKKYDLVIMDYQIAGGLRGESLIQQIKAIDHSLQIIVITKMTINISDFNFAKKLMRAGAFWYCTKYPGDIEDYIYQPTDFLMSIFNAYEKCQLEKISYRSNKKLSDSIEDTLTKKRMIGSSNSTIMLKEQIEKYAESDVNILISGPSGTGKELVANNIHFRSNRKFENFVPINCGGIPRDLIESELFGYEKGSFTGALNSKAGLFEIANNGTLFLDEVGELPMSAQVKLLRVIQEGELEKIGRTERINVNVRIIAATNKFLEKEVREGRFREDLYYRLNVVPIYVLPLKQRSEDILPLINHFMSLYSNDMGRTVPALLEDSLTILENYEWPGNVRELKNVVQRLLLNSDDEILPAEVHRAIWNKSNEQKKKFNEDQLINDVETLPLREMEKKFRKKYFRFVRKHSNSDAETARKLGLAPPNYYRMKKELEL
ncbi:MAG: sigma-54 dependent transcriptional regulator [Melioribacteraceae bacterium]|nr:sigma-54 dependent transcriptional regulator [Melioribacteraceae bacterium]MCF8353298.1 sigma-54 dependent transcriptional regulator [Melioribacteraceae bacterium]MCF8395413.1 sigma-54 dependent transcriptional regulator [Melioribacteraceae bacterium]MCF8418825.1 sigma-54 dependent transcriptional regulator [Melioribacteraceae bacterium]